MEDCSTDERLQQETLCRRHWTDGYDVRRTSRDVDEAERSRRLASSAVEYLNAICI